MSRANIVRRMREARRAQREAQAAPVERPGHWADPLDALGVENLHRLTPTLYRSAQPRARDVAALRSLGIRTVVSLRSFNDDREVFAGSGIRQAQQGDVGAVDGLGAAGCILAFGGRQGQDAQVLAVAQALMDLQAGGALVAIDEDQGKCAHGLLQCREDRDVRRIRTAGACRRPAW